MAPRQISGLRWAKEATSPWPTPKRLPKGAKGAGLSYEKALASALPQAKRGVWFEFEDQHGRGYCSPDLLLVGEDCILVLEVKLKNYLQAKAQLLGLYKPILTKLYAKPIKTVAVLKFLSPDSPKDLICPDLASALPLASNWVPIFHWLGRGSV